MQFALQRASLHACLQVGPCAGCAPPHTIAAALRSKKSLLAPAAIAVMLASLLAGCGSSSHPEGTEADPATAVPATAPLYVGATVRPTGGQESGALAAGRALTGSQNPYPRLLGALRTPGSPPLDFEHDVAPWLGPHVGLFARSLGSAGALLTPLANSLAGTGPVAALPFSPHGLDGALVMDTRDAGAARSFLATQAKHAGAHASSYRGVSYEVSPGGVAFGLVGRFAVIGSEAGLRAVIGATQGEQALSAAQGYSKLAGAAPQEALAHLYVSPGAALSAGGAAKGVLEALGGARATYTSLTASSGSLRLDVDTLPGATGARQGLLSADPQAAEALSQLPGESWLGIGIGHAGSTLPATTAALAALTSLTGSEEGGGLTLGTVVGALSGPLKVLGAETAAARRDYRAWMGPAGIFAAGPSVLQLKAGVSISSTDAAASRAAVGKLGAALRRSGDAVASVHIAGTEAAASVQLPGLPLELFIAAGPSSAGPKFVLALGEASVAAALSPSSTLKESPARAAAAATLGGGAQPSVIADVPTLLALLESISLTEDPSLSPPSSLPAGKRHRIRWRAADGRRHRTLQPRARAARGPRGLTLSPAKAPPRSRRSGRPAAARRCRSRARRPGCRP